MAQVIKTTFQLRRGSLEVWERNNPVLAKGEPSFVGALQMRTSKSYLEPS